jgi:hypothetical protein
MSGSCPGYRATDGVLAERVLPYGESLVVE